MSRDKSREFFKPRGGSEGGRARSTGSWIRRRSHGFADLHGDGPALTVLGFGARRIRPGDKVVLLHILPHGRSHTQYIATDTFVREEGPPGMLWI